MLGVSSGRMMKGMLVKLLTLRVCLCVCGGKLHKVFKTLSSTPHLLADMSLNLLLAGLLYVMIACLLRDLQPNDLLLKITHPWEDTVLLLVQLLTSSTVSRITATLVTNMVPSLPTNSYTLRLIATFVGIWATSHPICFIIQMQQPEPSVRGSWKHSRAGCTFLGSRCSFQNYHYCAREILGFWILQYRYFHLFQRWEHIHWVSRLSKSVRSFLRWCYASSSQTVLTLRF